MHQVSSSPVGGRNADSFSKTRMVIKMLFHLAVTFMQCSVSDLIVAENYDWKGLWWWGGCNLSFLHTYLITFYTYHLFGYIWIWIWVHLAAHLLRTSFEGPFRWRPFGQLSWHFEGWPPLGLVITIRAWARCCSKETRAPGFLRPHLQPSGHHQTCNSDWTQVVWKSV